MKTTLGEIARSKADTELKKLLTEIYLRGKEGKLKNIKINGK